MYFYLFDSKVKKWIELVMCMSQINSDAFLYPTRPPRVENLQANQTYNI